MREAVGLVAVRHEIFFPVRADMDDLLRHHYAAETHSGVLLHELVVVAGEVDDLRVFAAFAENFLEQHVVIITPEPFVSQFPAVDEIADEIKVSALGDAEKFQQLRNSRVLRAEVDVGNPDGTIAQFGCG